MMTQTRTARDKTGAQGNNERNNSWQTLMGNKIKWNEIYSFLVKFT